MSLPASPNPRSISPWWALLLVFPAALVLGLAVGGMPVPATPPAPVTVAAPGPDAPPVAAPEARAATPAAASPFESSAPKAPPQEASRWTSYDDAIAESNRSGRPVLIDFNAEWCGPCRMMKDEVFDDPSLDLALRREVIPVSVTDRTREDGSNPADVEDLMRRYSIRAFPTLVVFSPRSGRETRIAGYLGAVRTLEWITEAAREVR